MMFPTITVAAMLLAASTPAIVVDAFAPVRLYQPITVSSSSSRDSFPTLSLSLASSSSSSALEELASMTVLSIDSGDLDVVQKYSKTSLVTDCTTNPLFVSQAGANGDARYQAMVADAITYAKETLGGGDASLPNVEEQLALAMDKLAVNLGAQLLQLVPGRVSTEVDIRLSYDTEASLRRARRIIALYAEMGIPKDRILIKLAGTWEGIQAAKVLESQDKIRCNITLVFSFLQAAAAAQAGVYLISPFPGRILDWYKAQTTPHRQTYHPTADPGVVLVKRMYAYFRKYNYDTICMPASWRSSSGGEDVVDEILALAGVDEMTIPANLLEELLLRRPASDVVRQCDPKLDAAICLDPDFILTKDSWEGYWATDRCGQEKLKEGMDAFTTETEKLLGILMEQW